MPQRIKSLELQGYKTFANKTRFEFAETITAIVGPNGSGKSNIVDALRWVLGEQSYGLLRGKKTADMIFSGSEQRSRASMASATVIFDNSQTWLPIDFSEVAITRRAYRDGQNEYLLNNHKVRLREVTELLAQAGLSERTYTVIGQGLVDEALSLRADERRRLFEEAAGIGLYRSRREEALRRLDTTRRNLERVQDILAELEPRLQSLERQAQRAQQYEQIKADLRQVLREWYGFHWHRTQMEFVKAQEFAKTQQAALDAARDNQASLAQKLAALRDEIQGLRARLNSWHRQLAGLHTQREEISRELAVLVERLRSLQEQRQSSNEELARLNEELGLHQEHYQQVTQEVEHQRVELEEAGAQVEAASQALQARQMERAQLEATIQQAQSELSDQQTCRDHIRTRLVESQVQIEHQKTALSASDQVLAIAVQELRAAQDNLKAAAKNLKQAVSARQKAENTWQTHQDKVADVEKARQQIQDRDAALKAEMGGLKAQLEVLQQAEQALTGYASGTRLLLQSSRQAQLSGVKGALIPNLEVPVELETAVAAALGEYLNAVLLEGEASSGEALDLLASEPARAVLLPLKSLVPPEPLSPPQDDAFLGIAADLVGAPPELRPAVDLLLGSVIVVRDRKAARRALVGQPVTARAVTLQGEVFYASGPILAGKEGEASTLSRPRQVREAKEALSQAERDAAKLETRTQNLEQQLLDLHSAGEKLESALQEAREKEREAMSAHHRATLTLEQAQHQAQQQKDQRLRLEEDIARIEQQSEQMSTELGQSETCLSELLQKQREQQAALLRLPLDEFQAQVSYWDMQCTLAERAQENELARQRERQSTLDRASSTKARLEEKLAELDDQQGKLEIEQGRLRRSELEISAQVNTVQQQIEPAESELSTTDGRQAQMQVEDETTRQVQSRAEQRNAQASIALVRQQEALQSMRSKIEEDFGLVAFEYADEVPGPKPLPLDGMVETLPQVDELSPDLEEALRSYRTQLRRIGPINPEAQQEHREVKERFQFLTFQVADLEKAEADIRQVINELDGLMQSQFHKTFEAVAEEFRKIFNRLFSGGTARLVLTNAGDLSNAGVEIEVRLPGRRTHGLSLLSGGERSLTAAALVFALLKTSPTPFCVLDEVDAMLDEVNIGRFGDLLAELSAKTQFVVVTHNRNTVQVADVIYGVTMNRDSTSQVISLRLDEVADLEGVE